MLTTRQAIILRIIVTEYIRLAIPISSKLICQRCDFKISSATIRNECSKLEQWSYLETTGQTNGRIPATKGYRYYVDHLINLTSDLNMIKQQINQLFGKRSNKIEDILKKSGEIISKMSKLTVLVSGPDLGTEFLQKLKIIKISDFQALIVFVLSNGHIENQIFNLDKNSFSDLRITIEIFNKILIGSKIKDLITKFTLIKPILKTQILNYENILEQFSYVLLSITNIHKSTQGIKYMLTNPEFNNPANIKKVMDFIESTSPFVNYQMHQQKNNKPADVVLQIGREYNSQEDNLVIISSKFCFNKFDEGGITLIGPKRTEYAKIIPLLKWFFHRIQTKYYYEKPLLERR